MHDYEAQEWHEQILAQVHAIIIINESVFADRKEAGRK